MKELTHIQIKEVHGGALVAAFLTGVAIGALAKKLYNKYQASQAAESAESCPA